MLRLGDLLLEHVPPRGPARGVPLLMVHGMHGGSWYLRNYREGAADDGWDAFALNLRGHHGSRPVADLGRVSVRDYVEDARDCLAALGPCVVLGHSMGGLVAQKLAEGEPRVRAGVFVTSAPPRGVLALRWPVVSRMAPYLPALLASRPFVIGPEAAAALLGHRLAPEVQAWAYERLVPESGRAGRELAVGAIAVDAARVGAPTLVVGAELDRMTPADVQRRIAAHYGSDYLEAAGHAHLLMLEDGWAAPFASVLGWLARRIDAPRGGVPAGPAAPAPPPGRS